jgi:hypothetical protein
VNDVRLSTDHDFASVGVLDDPGYRDGVVWLELNRHHEDGPPRIPLANLTPAEARELAAQLIKAADATDHPVIDGEVEREL